MKAFLILIILSLSLYTVGFTQEKNYSADELFMQAREAAFENKDYPKAISLIKKAINQAPNYSDLSIFLGRLYTWTDQIDSAQAVFEELRQKKVNDEDFYLAYGSLLYWNDLSSEANQIVDEGLAVHTKSEDLYLLKAKIKYSSAEYSEASKVVEKLLQLNPRHTEGWSLSNRIKDYSAKNAVKLNYSLTHFDKQFADNWHIASLSYKRATSLGSVIAKVNFANKFASNGMQFELEAYPRINKVFYMYVGAGYSNNVGIFPKFRTGASLYANLPKSFEGELGFRQLHFSKNIWMYTASVGKYYRNYWFNLRTYLTPGENNISHSYTGTLRYYTKGANDYFGFQIGTGISPEENRSNLLDIQTYKLKTFKIGVDYNFSIGRSHLINMSSTYFNQEYRLNEKGNQIDFSVGYSKVF